MKGEYKIIDDFLPTPVFREISDWFLSSTFPWYHISEVAYGREESDSFLGTEHEDLFSIPLTKEQEEYNFHFVHKIYQNHELWTNDRTWDKIRPIISKLDVNALIRIKINYYPKTHKLIHHPYHIDYAYKHKGAVFYLNENDGLTVLEDGTEIKSIPNRMLLLDTSKPHHSTTTTNADRRLIMNINWM